MYVAKSNMVAIRILGHIALRDAQLFQLQYSIKINFKSPIFSLLL
jgi:hypothetical protein